MDSLKLYTIIRKGRRGDYFPSDGRYPSPSTFNNRIPHSNFELKYHSIRFDRRDAAINVVIKRRTESD